ncbi:PadR family transcriptional regulator [candidate division KSB1 bacterium]
MLTKLEEQVLMTVWRFRGDGYGVNIFEYLEELNDKKLTLGVVYDILERLSRNGLVKTQFGNPTPVRGGMRKKYYIITESGIKELVKAKEVYNKVMEGFNELLDQRKTGNV